jgi:Zn-dependent protease/predicted transcriptional regulator
MSRGIKLFRVIGIQISIDYTWFIVFVLFAWSLAYGYFPSRQPGLGNGAYIFMGLASSLLLFACVLAHELAHSYTANRLGLGIRGITLFIFGGVAEITKEPEDAGVELKVAVAGPAASGVLAGVFWAAARAIGGSYPMAHAILSYLSTINLVLLVFNMIPGLPLDGGRVLRALWWARTGDVAAATRVTSAIGKGFAFFLIIAGFVQIVMGNFTGVWSVLIGVFLQQAAEGGYRQMLIKRALDGVKVRDVMTRGAVSIEETATISEAVDDYFFRHHFVSYPVTSGGVVVGLLTLNGVKAVDKGRWHELRVRDVMRPLGPEDVTTPEEGAMEALIRLMSSANGRFPVLDDGSLVGVVSKRDILKMLEFKSGLGRPT